MDNFTINYDGNDEGSSNSNYRHINVPYLVVHAVACFLGIIGNGLVIWFSIFKMKKTVRLMWFLNLAIADFTFALSLPLLITYNALNNWLFGSFLCKLSVFLYFFNVSLSGLQLMVISVDRFICVTFPQWCHNHRTRRLTFIIILIIWILSAASCVVFIIFSDTHDRNYEVSCHFKLQHGMKLNTMIRFVFLIAIPFIVIVLSYLGIALCNLKRHITLCSRSCATTMSVIIAFFVCCIPQNVFFILMISGAIDYYYVDKFVDITESIRVISICVNPIIYVLVGWELKGNVCSSFQVMFEKAFAEEEDITGFRRREDREVSLNLNGSPNLDNSL